MRIKRIERGYTAFLSDIEFGMLQRIIAHFDIKEEWPKMTLGERRSWGRRTHGGEYFRVDSDERVHKF